jgi:radical SAM protein with 4Fe4S-binding SPASM domain
MGMFRNLMVGALPQYTRKARHLQLLLRHSTPKKLMNVLSAELALRRGRTSLTSMPYVYIIDPCNACNLRCPLCPTGTGTLRRPTKMMSLECFVGIVDQIEDHAIEVIFHNWGEPFLNPHIFDMIAYVKAKNIGSTLSSHFNNVSDEMIERILDSGLEHLTVSLDGATDEVYQTYRVRGNLDNALTSLRRLQQRKRERRQRLPMVEWQYIVMKHNEHELEAARAIARELGVERFRPLSPGLPFDHTDDVELANQWIPENAQYRASHPEKVIARGYLHDEPCFYPYRSMVVNPDGGVAPCCAVYHKKFDFGNVQGEPLREIWNSKRYQSARSLFSDHPISDPVATICDGCLLYKQKRGRTVQPATSVGTTH